MVWRKETGAPFSPSFIMLETKCCPLGFTGTSRESYELGGLKQSLMKKRAISEDPYDSVSEEPTNCPQRSVPNKKCQVFKRI